ncbi:hypothetical protein TVAG_098770 [Trichomonas vaginalis G3]|nr:Alba nucleic acid-binding protein family [Trichomonas vaginalis G3]EAY06166.1 hypothetical protein TVAG_098770 [Trichomonas vaginalis G3]KAI5544310.1 Alba nucleic acid-binding protein family [Trichomonas vaginalis G3]|eukprot:XP_001318389.1 hypothetical protein [Trichomonas vaginalis G3]
MEVVNVKQHTQMKTLIEYCEKRIDSDNSPGITIVGEEKAVNKAISIAEILKNKYSLIETTTLEESVAKNEPKLTIYLKKT